MKNRTTYLKIFLVAIVISQACVPPAYFSEVETERDDFKNEKEGLFNENEKLTVENTEIKADLELAAKEQKRIEELGMANAEELKILKGRYNQLDNRYEELQQAHNALMSGSDSETRSLMEKLENTQKDLYQREDQLNQMQAKLDKDREELNNLQGELRQKNARLIDLEQVLNK